MVFVILVFGSDSLLVVVLGSESALDLLYSFFFNFFISFNVYEFFVLKFIIFNVCLIRAKRAILIISQISQINQSVSQSINQSGVAGSNFPDI